MAYTEIRDKVGTNRAPLPAFLAITAPFVGLINPNDYLRIHGWDIIEQDGQFSAHLARLPILLDDVPPMNA